jgi:hypothetical protein
LKSDSSSATHCAASSLASIIGEGFVHRSR